MKKQGMGAIVNNGSDWSVVAGENAFPYIMSKGAVGMMTKAMAIDNARAGIRVNAVCPGDTFVDRWIEKGYFEGSDPVSIEEAIKESSSYIPLRRPELMILMPWAPRRMAFCIARFIARRNMMRFSSCWAIESAIS